MRLTRLRRDYGVASTAAATTLTSMMHRKRTMIDGIKGADRSQRLWLQFFCGWYSIPLQHKCSPHGRGYNESLIHRNRLTMRE